MASEGSFIPQVRHDILVEAIGIKERGRRVRGVEQGIIVRVYFRILIKSEELCKKEMDDIVNKNLEEKLEHE